jgi:hypothetical protein
VICVGKADQILHITGYVIFFDLYNHSCVLW